MPIGDDARAGAAMERGLLGSGGPDLGQLDRHQVGTAAEGTVVLTTAMPCNASASRWILVRLLLAVGAPLPTSAAVHDDTFRRLQTGAQIAKV